MLFRLAGFGAVAGLSLEAARVFAGSNEHTVIPGRVYRSAQMSREKLERTIDREEDPHGDQPARLLSQHAWYLDEARATHATVISQEDITLSAKRYPHPGEIGRLIEVFDHTDYPVDPPLRRRRGPHRPGRRDRDPADDRPRPCRGAAAAVAALWPLRRRPDRPARRVSRLLRQLARDSRRAAHPRAVPPLVRGPLLPRPVPGGIETALARAAHRARAPGLHGGDPGHQPLGRAVDVLAGRLGRRSAALYALHEGRRVRVSRPRGLTRAARFIPANRSTSPPDFRRSLPASTCFTPTCSMRSPSTCSTPTSRSTARSR